MLGSGDAVLFPVKGKFYTSEGCFDCWLVGNGFPIFVFLIVTQVKMLCLNNGSSSVTEPLLSSHLGFETVAHITGRQLFQ